MKIQIKRGLKLNLPSNAPNGEPLFTTDSKELFFGTGTGIEEVSYVHLDKTETINGEKTFNNAVVLKNNITEPTSKIDKLYNVNGNLHFNGVNLSQSSSGTAICVDWKLENSFSKNQLILNQGILYRANENIPVNTPFTEGESGLTFLRIDEEEDEDMINGQLIPTRGFPSLTNAIPCDGRILKKTDYVDKYGKSLSDIVGKQLCIDSWIENGTTKQIYNFYNASNVPHILKKINNGGRFALNTYQGAYVQNSLDGEFTTSFSMTQGSAVVNMTPTHEGVTNGTYGVFLSSENTTLLFTPNAVQGGGDMKGSLVKIKLPKDMYSMSSVSSVALTSKTFGVIVNNIFYTIGYLKDVSEAFYPYMISYDLVNKRWEDTCVRLPKEYQSKTMFAEGLNVGFNNTHILIRPNRNYPVKRVAFYKISNKSWEFSNLPESPIYNNTGTLLGLTYVYGATSAYSADGAVLLCGCRNDGSNQRARIWYATPSQTAVVNTLYSIDTGGASQIFDVTYNTTMGLVYIANISNTYKIYKSPDTSTASTEIYSTSLVASSPLQSFLYPHPTKKNVIMVKWDTSQNEGGVSYGRVGILKDSNYYYVTPEDIRGVSDGVSSASNIWATFMTFNSVDYFVVTCSPTGGNSLSSPLMFRKSIDSISANGLTGYSTSTIPFMALQSSNSGQVLGAMNMYGLTDTFSYVTAGASSILSYDGINWRLASLGTSDSTASYELTQNDSGSLITLYNIYYGTVLYSKDKCKTWCYYNTDLVDTFPKTFLSSGANGGSQVQPIMMDSFKDNIVFAKIFAGGTISLMSTQDMVTFSTCNIQLNVSDYNDSLLGFAIDKDSVNRTIYLLMSNGAMYTATFTGDVLPSLSTLVFTKNSTVKQLPQLTNPYYSISKSFLKYIKLNSGEQRLYVFSPSNTNIGYYMKYGDTKWTRLEGGGIIPAGTSSANFVPNYQMYNGLFEMCGTVCWSSGANLLIHDGDQVNQCVQRADGNQSNYWLICNEGAGKFSVLNELGLIYFMNSEPYDCSQYFQMPVHPHTQIYWKPY